MAEKTMVEAVRDAMFEEMKRDERIILMGEDVGAGRRLPRHRGLRGRVRRGPLYGYAAGGGLHRGRGDRRFAQRHHSDRRAPVRRLQPPRLRPDRQRGRAPPLPLERHLELPRSPSARPYGAGIHGGPYHSQSIEAFYAHVPGLKVICVATPYDAKGLLKSAIRDPNPVIFLEHKKAYRAYPPGDPRRGLHDPHRRGRDQARGNRHHLITYGMMMHHSLKAAETVEQEDGTSVEVIDLRTSRRGTRSASWSPSRRRARRSSSTRTTSPAGSAPRSRRRSPRTASSTSTARSRASLRRTCRSRRTRASWKSTFCRTRRRSPKPSASWPPTRRQRQASHGLHPDDAGGR